ncbi:MAG: methyltransferase domain-containing protein [Candidatus Hodarchaeales archaeon]
MKAIFATHLAADHPEIAINELEALFDLQKICYSRLDGDFAIKNIVLHDITTNTPVYLVDKLKIVMQRAAMAHGIYIVIKNKSEAVGDWKLDNYFERIDNFLQGIDFTDTVPEGLTFKVRIKRLGVISSAKLLKKETKAIEKLTSDYILRCTGGKVNLEQSDIVFKFFLSEKDIIFTRLVHESDRKSVFDRFPCKRAFFHSSAMRPFLIRAMINLGKAGYRESMIVLDPFCGTGGFLIELVDMIGNLELDIKLLGLDFNKWMVRGTKRNLQPGKIELLCRADAIHLPLKPETVDLIVTDPPYGINASTAGNTAESIINDSLAEMEKILKIGGLLVFTMTNKVKVNYEETGLKPILKLNNRVHKSLTRILYVFEKTVNNNKLIEKNRLI